MERALWKLEAKKGEGGRRGRGPWGGEQSDARCLPLMGSASLSFIPTRKQAVPLAITQLFLSQSDLGILDCGRDNNAVHYSKEPGAISFPKKRIFPSMNEKD